MKEIICEKIWQILFRVLPLNVYLKIKYKRNYGESLNLDNPMKLSEKLYWLKVYYGQYMKKDIVQLYDKYTVRSYVREKIGEKYLTSLYGVYDNINDIEFDKFPNKYVLKITQSCAKNIIVNSNMTMTREEMKLKLKEWLMETNDACYQISMFKEENYYYNSEAKIICEEYLDIGNNKSPEDIRVYCFNGIPKFISVDYESVTDDGIKKSDYSRNVFDTSGVILPIEFGRKSDKSQRGLNKDIIQELLNISTKLSQPFPFVRVDLYIINDSIKFGELTWIPMGGNCKINPKEYDEIMGSWLNLPNIKLDYKNMKRELININ